MTVRAQEPKVLPPILGEARASLSELPKNLRIQFMVLVAQVIGAQAVLVELVDQMASDASINGKVETSGEIGHASAFGQRVNQLVVRQGLERFRWRS